MTKHEFLKAVRQTHLYLGVFIAPAVLFFSFTGFLQMFSLHETTRGSSYVPPAIIVKMASIHKKAALPGPPRPPAPPKVSGDKAEKPAAPPAPVVKPSFHWPLKIFFGLVAVGLILSTFSGLYMAWKFTRPHLVLAAVFVAGIVIPVVCLAV